MKEKYKHTNNGIGLPTIKLVDATDVDKKIKLVTTKDEDNLSSDSNPGALQGVL